MRRRLKDGPNDVGKASKDFEPQIPVGGAGMAKNHCMINYNAAEDTTMVYPNETDSKNYTVKVNGELVEEPTQLNPGDRILFGSHIYYLYVNPKINKDATYNHEAAVKEANKD